MSNEFDNNELTDVAQKLRYVRGHIKNVPPELYDFCDYLAKYFEENPICNSSKSISPYTLCLLVEAGLNDIKSGNFYVKDFKKLMELYDNKPYILLGIKFFPLIIDKLGGPKFASEFRKCFSINLYSYGKALPPVDETPGKYGTLVVKKNVVDISKKDMAAVLAKLYNYAHPQGFGFLHYSPTPMDVEKARIILDCEFDIDVLGGRILKINFNNLFRFSTRKYNDINGDGIAEILISQCPNVY